MTLNNPKLTLSFLGEDVSPSTLEVDSSRILKESVSSTFQLFSSLKSSSRQMSLSLRRKTPAIESIIRTEGDILAVLTDGSATIFTGYLSTNYSWTLGEYGEEALSLTIEDVGSSDFSRLFGSITEEKADKFFKNLNSKNPRVGKDENTYHSFDSTAISSYSDDISDVEVSKGKQDLDLKHFAIAAVHSGATNRCAYYRVYRGNIPDCKTIDNFVSVSKEMGYPFKRVTVDRGYCTAENIYFIHNELKADMLAMIPSHHTMSRKAIEKVRGKFEDKSENYISGQDVYGTTVPDDITFTAKDKEVKLYAYVHVYFSPSRKAEETAKLHAELEDKITSLNIAFNEGKITLKDAVDRNFSADHKDCIKVVRTSNTKVVFQKDNEAIAKALENAGYFCVFSTEKMDYRKALLYYRHRDGIERVFNILKNDIGFKRALVKTDETLQGKVFCAMLSTMIACYIKTKMKEARDNGIINRKLTYRKAVHELDCIYTYQMGAKTVWSEVSERQKTIYSFLEIESPAEAKKIKIKRQNVKKKQLK